MINALFKSYPKRDDKFNMLWYARFYSKSAKLISQKRYEARVLRWIREYERYLKYV